MSSRKGSRTDKGWYRPSEKNRRDIGVSMASNVGIIKREGELLWTVPRGYRGAKLVVGSSQHLMMNQEDIESIRAERKSRKDPAPKSSSAKQKSSHEVAPAESHSGRSRVSREPSDTGGRRTPHTLPSSPDNDLGQSSSVPGDERCASPAVDSRDKPDDYDQEPDTRSVRLENLLS